LATTVSSGNLVWWLKLNENFFSLFFLQALQLPAAQQLGKSPTKQSHSKQFIQQKAA